MSGAAAGPQSWERTDVPPHHPPSPVSLVDLLERVLGQGTAFPPGSLGEVDPGDGDEDGTAERTSSSPSVRTAPA
ncbi:hypothetical protein [Streptomyces albidoflavus]|uniref:hypothetical protein n=1 Tax=Streptomyces albidoflavus TaxID=1886 RepID=UPI0033B4FD3D